MVSLRSLLFLGAVGLAWGKSQLYGMNIAGFEFGCAIDGTCPLTTIIPPIKSLGGGDGAAQMAHFVNDDGMNVFRLPVSWQYLTGNVIGPLNTKNLASYDLLMQSCLKTGAYCVIDVHNFARWNGEIVGQGGPTDAQFADLWTQLATKYADNPFVILGLTNEPHDLDVPTWVVSAQTAVTAIRKAETVSHIILLPGTNFTSAGTFVTASTGGAGWGPALAAVVNPDKSTTDLIFDLHKYLDIDNSGNHVDCVTDNIATAFAPVATWLRTNQRQALLSETGAGASTSCFTDFCAQNEFINANSDVYLGYIAWGAGSLTGDYILSLTPNKTGTKWVDAPLAVSCVIDPWAKAAAPTVTGTFGLVLPTGTAMTSSSASTTTTPSGSAATNGGSGSGGTQTSLAAGTTKTLTPASGSKNSASGVQVASGLMLASLLLSMMLL